MVYDIDMLRSFYSNFPKRVDAARKHVGRPLTLAEKILYAHLYNESDVRPFRRGEDYVNFRPDRVAMQDATAQMALLQFMNAGKSKSAVPATVHCDHLIQANMGAKTGLLRPMQKLMLQKAPLLLQKLPPMRLIPELLRQKHPFLLQ